MSKKNIGILTFPTGKAGVIPLSNLVSVLLSISNSLVLITGNEGYKSLKNNHNLSIFEIVHEQYKSMILRSSNYLLTQIKMSLILFNVNSKVDFWIFFFGETLILPLIVAKLLGKKVYLMCAGSSFKSSAFTKDPLANLVNILEQCCYFISDQIIIYYPNLVNEFNLYMYKNKIKFCHEHFINLEEFRIKLDYQMRPNIIGYVGRLSNEKGILNFIGACEMIVNKQGNFKFVIIGEGPLFNHLNSYINSNHLNDKIELIGWVPHNELSDYLNKIKLLVVPSYTEGLPNLVLEAMACGTPILASNVGAIPDIIKDNETGFILRDNSAESITRIIESLDYQEMEGLIKAARVFVEREFSYESTVKSFKQLLRIPKNP